MATVFVYRTQLSKGAKDLAEAIPDGMRWRDRLRPLETKVRTGDRVIAWGEYNDRLPTTIPCLNNKPLTNKYDEALRLAAEGVPTIEVSRTKPQDVVRVIPAAADAAAEQWERLVEIAEDFANIEIDATVPRHPVTIAAVDTLLRQATALRQALGQPIPQAREERTTAVGWLGRDKNHVGGADLLTPVTQPDFFVKKIDDIVKEYRVHSFLGKSIRSGIKDVRIDDAWVASGQTPHLWIRGWDGGWRIKYDGESCKQKHRVLAAQAITALGLDFGAVDIGERANGDLVVFEVNRAPGVEGGTIEAYVKAIEVWKNGGWAAADAAGN